MATKVLGVRISANDIFTCCLAQLYTMYIPYDEGSYMCAHVYTYDTL